MRECSRTHLASYGDQSKARLMTSIFIIHRRPLELPTIIRESLSHADLASLYALLTGTGQETLLEEAIHLAVGILMYRMARTSEIKLRLFLSSACSDFYLLLSHPEYSDCTQSLSCYTV
jgi:hypothetical protein